MTTTVQIIIAGITLVLVFSAMLTGATVWIITRIASGDASVLERLDKYHEQNRIRVDAMQALLIRHDTLLSPEFPGHNGMNKRPYPNVKS